MGCLDESTITAHIDAIDAKLAIFYATPEKMFNYTVGSVKVDKVQAIKLLLDMKKQFLSLLDKLSTLNAVEYVDHFDYLHNRFGEFEGTLIGDDQY